MEKINDHFNNENASFPSATEIGREFVRQYYTKWSFQLGDVYQFYGNESVFSYDGHEANGQESIQKAVNALGYDNCKARIHSVNGLYGVNDSLILQVCGELSVNGAAPRKFLQSFILCKQMTKKYYVQTDIFQWLDKAFCSDFAMKKANVSTAVAPTDTTANVVNNSNYGDIAVKEKDFSTHSNEHYMSGVISQEHTQQQQLVAPMEPVVGNFVAPQVIKEVEKPSAPNTQQNGHGLDNQHQIALDSNAVVPNANSLHLNEATQQQQLQQQQQLPVAKHQSPQQQQPNPQDNYPKTWAKAVSNNASVVNNNAASLQQQQDYNSNAAAGLTEADVKDSVNNFDEDNAARKNNFKSYGDKRNTGEYRGHFNNNGHNNYRYQYREGGGQQSFRGGNRGAHGGSRFAGPGGNTRNYTSYHQGGGGGSHQSGAPMGNNSRYGPPGGGGNRFTSSGGSGGSRTSGGNRLQGQPHHHASQNMKTAQD